MEMNKKEYEQLIEWFVFLNDKIESCYKRETDALVERLKEEYKKYIKTYI